RRLDPRVEDERFQSALHDLVGRGILRPLGDVSEQSTTYVFVHTLARDVAYAGIPKAERARRHALVALAAGHHHAWAAGEIGAIQVLVSALAAASDAGVDRVTGEALRQLGLIDYLIGRLSSAETRFREALALADRVGDRRGAGWALQHLAWSATTRGDYGLA